MPLVAFFTSAMLEKGYWLNVRPAAMSGGLVGGIFAFFGWFLVMTLVLRVLARSSRKAAPLRADVYRRFGSMLAWVAVFGWLFLFCSYEQVPFFGMRVWFLLVALVFAVWLARVVWYVSHGYPRRKREEAERERLKKYLP